MVSHCAAILAAVALAAAASAPAADAFTSAVAPGRAPPLHAALDDASAIAMSEYMARSHEEKLRAVKAVEDAKNEEIAALRAEIERLRGAPAPVAPAAPAAVAPFAPVPSSEAEAKLASYQNFVAEYIVSAQNQKLLAVKEAELKAEKKFQERLEALMAAGTAAPPAVAEYKVAPPAPVEKPAGKVPAAPVDKPAAALVAEAAPVDKPAAAPVAEAAAVAAPPEETPSVATVIFQARNAEIVAAADAGKSRWGSKEIERAREELKSAPAAAATGPEAKPTLFESRNAEVVAAANAGKSRWGVMEVEKVKGMVNGKVEPPAKANGTKAPSAIAPEIEDEKPQNGWERVNIGARLVR